MRCQHHVDTVELRAAGGMHRDGESSVFAAVRLALIDGFRIKVGHQFSHSRTDCLGKVRYGSTHHFDGKVAGKFKQ